MAAGKLANDQVSLEGFDLVSPSRTSLK